MESRKNGVDDLCKAEIETQTYRINVWILRRKGVDELGDWN